MLDDLILQDLLVAKAPALKIEVPTADLDAAFTNARGNLSDEQFKQELTRRNLTEADVRESLRRQLLAEKVLEQEVSKQIAIGDPDVTQFFDANRAQFNLAEESYHIAQIVITPQRDPQVANTTGDDAATPQEAVAKARTIMEKLKGGASFRELATSYSEDPASAQRGGDMGLIPVSQLQQAPPALRNAVLNKTAGHGERGERRQRRLHDRAGGGARGRRPARPRDARRQGPDHQHAEVAKGGAAARGLSDGAAQRRRDREPPGASRGPGQGHAAVALARRSASAPTRPSSRSSMPFRLPRLLPVQDPRELVEIRIAETPAGRTGSFRGRRPQLTQPLWELLPNRAAGLLGHPGRGSPLLRPRRRKARPAATRKACG